MAKKPEKINEPLEDSEFPARFVKDPYDRAVRGALGEANDSIWDAMNRGVGKGALIAGLGALALATIGGGVMGQARMFGAELGVPSVAQTLGFGLDMGFRAGVDFLYSGLGLLTVGLGAALGGVMDLQKQQNGLTLEIAKSRAEARAKEKQAAVEGPAKSAEAPAKEPTSKEPPAAEPPAAAKPDVPPAPAPLAAQTQSIDTAMAGSDDKVFDFAAFLAREQARQNAQGQGTQGRNA